jgi:CheY-like chemotaxis protein
MGSGQVRAALALTGGRGDDDIDASRAAGFQMHLSKPCGPDTLLHVAYLLTQREN